MKYYLVIIQNSDTQAVFAYESYDEALVRFHSELAYRGNGRVSTVCTILDGEGVSIRTEMWKRPIE